MPTPTPSTLTSLLEWPSFLQAEERLKYLLGKCSLSVREHAELQYFSYLIARIRFILDNTPEDELSTEFKKLLCEVHKLTLGTDFSYTANPDSSANLLLYDIALLVAATEELGSCDTHMGRVLRVLVPEASPYLNPPDPVGGPNNQTLQQFSKTHLYLHLRESCHTFVAIKDIAGTIRRSAGQPLETIKIQNSFGNLDSPDSLGCIIEFHHIKQLFRSHSPQTSALMEAERVYSIVFNDKDNLPRKLNRFCAVLLSSSTKFGQEYELKANEQIYPDLYYWFNFYIGLKQEIKDRIPGPVKEELEIVVDRATNYQEAKEGSTSSCLRTRGDRLKIALEQTENASALAKLSDEYTQSGQADLLSKVEACEKELLEKIEAGTYEGREATSISDEAFMQRIDELFLEPVAEGLKIKLKRALLSEVTESLAEFNQLSEKARSGLFIDVIGGLSYNELLQLLESISAGSLDCLIDHSPFAHSFDQYLGTALSGSDVLLVIFKNIDLEQWKALIQSPRIRKIMVDVISSDKPWLAQLLAIVNKILDQNSIGEVPEAAEELWVMLPALNSRSGDEGENIEEIDRNFYGTIAKLLVGVNDEQSRILIGHLLQDLRFTDRGALNVLRESFVHMAQDQRGALLGQFLEATENPVFVRRLLDLLRESFVHIAQTQRATLSGQLFKAMRRFGLEHEFMNVLPELFVHMARDQRGALLGQLLEATENPVFVRRLLDLLRESFVHTPQDQRVALLGQFLETTENPVLVRRLLDLLRESFVHTPQDQRATLSGQLFEATRRSGLEHEFMNILPKLFVHLSQDQRATLLGQLLEAAQQRSRFLVGDFINVSRGLFVRIAQDQQAAFFGQLFETALQSSRFKCDSLRVLGELFVHIPQDQQATCFDQFLRAAQRSGLVRHLGDINKILFYILNSPTTPSETSRNASAVLFLSIFSNRADKYLEESDSEQLANFIQISSLLTAHDGCDACFQAILARLQADPRYQYLLTSSTTKSVLEVRDSLDKPSHQELFMRSFASGNHLSSATRTPDERQRMNNQIDFATIKLAYTFSKARYGGLFFFKKYVRMASDRGQRLEVLLNEVLDRTDPEAKLAILNSNRLGLEASSSDLFPSHLESELRSIVDSFTVPNSRVACCR